MSVGFRTGLVLDDTRPDWDGAGPRPISWAAWYPPADGAVATEIVGGGPAASFFRVGAVAQGAPLRAGARPWPIVVISHGTGGTALGMAWLGHRLAQRGFVVLAPNHHGNTAVEPYRPEGFLCWWERARDLSVLLDRLPLEDGFAGHLDGGQAFAIGFSLGGHTALPLLGAVTDMERFRVWAEAAGLGRGPREFPDLTERFAELMATSAVFRASWGRHADSYRDHRVHAAVLLAPAPTVRGFTDASLTTIAAPVHIMTGGSDAEAPAEVGAFWLAERLPRCTLDVVSPDAGHFVFLPEATEVGRRHAADLCQDAPGVDRGAIHHEVATAAAALFGSCVPRIET